MAVNTFSGLVRAPSFVHETIYVCLTPEEQARLEATCRLFRNVIPKIYAERALLSTGPAFYANLVPPTHDGRVSPCSAYGAPITVRVTDVDTKLPIRVFQGVVNKQGLGKGYGDEYAIWPWKGRTKIKYRQDDRWITLISKDTNRGQAIMCDGCIKFVELISDDTKVLVLSDNGGSPKLEILDLITKEKTLYSLPTSFAIKSMEITPDDRTAILAGADNNILFFDLEKGGCRHSIQANIECIPMTEDPALFDAGIALFAIRNQLREAQVGNMLPSAIVPVIFRQILDLPPIVSTPILENLPYGEYSSFKEVIDAIDQFTQAAAHKEVSEGKKD